MNEPGSPGAREEWKKPAGQAGGFNRQSRPEAQEWSVLGEWGRISPEGVAWREKLRRWYLRLST